MTSPSTPEKPNLATHKRRASPLQQYRARFRSWEAFIGQAGIGYDQINPDDVDLATLFVCPDKIKGRVGDSKRGPRMDVDVRNVMLPKNVYAALQLAAEEWSCHRLTISTAQVIKLACILFVKYGIPALVKKREYEAEILAQRLTELKPYMPPDTLCKLRQELCQD